MTGILLIGGGALARDMIDAYGRDRFGAVYVDPGYPAAPLPGLPLYDNWREAAKASSAYVLAVSGIEHRVKAALAAEEAGLTASAPLVSSKSVVSPDATLELGTVIGHMAVIGPTAQLGRHVLVMHGAIVAHDCAIEPYSVLCAGVALGGAARVGARTFIGANSVVAPNIRIGADCHLAAGAACLREAAPGTRWIGNPARLASRA